MGCSASAMRDVTTPTLAYGTATGVGPVRCASATTGITGTVTSGKGCRINTAGITTSGASRWASVTAPSGWSEEECGVEQLELEQGRPVVHRLDHVDAGVGGRAEEVLGRRQGWAATPRCAAVAEAPVTTWFSIRLSVGPTPRRIIGSLCGVAEAPPR